MYRYEVDPNRKIMVLVVHGMQDGWEARLMQMEWINRSHMLSDKWSFILDLTHYLGGQNEASKFQGRFSNLVSRQQLNACVAIAPANRESADSFLKDGKFTEETSFDEAWKKAGGEDRMTTLAPPENGSRFPANNPPPGNQ